MTELVIPPPTRAFDAVMDDGAVIRIRQHGGPGAVRVVLSHGNGFAADAYYPFWRLLLDRFEVVLFDFRNYGQNPFHDRDAHTYPRLVRDLERIERAIVDGLGAKPTVGAFHSLSARASMKRAIDSGWLWDALVLFDPPMVPPQGHPLFQAALDDERKLSRWARGRRERFDDPARLAREFAAARSLRRWTPGAHALAARSVLHFDAAAGAWLLNCPGELEARIYAGNTGLELWPRFEAFERPLLLVGADPEAEDAAPPALCNRAIGEEYGYRYEAIEDSGHFLQLERPAACAAAMTAFLADVGLGA